MWNRADVKAQAKVIMKRNYWKMFVVSLLTGLLTKGVASTQIEFDDLNLSFDIQQFLVAIISIIGLLAILYGIFIANPIKVGKAGYYLKNHDENPPLADMFSAFKSNYLNTVGTMLVMDIKIFLWTLLLIVPGIVKSYEYSMIPYIIAEDPSTSMNDAFAKSKEMTTGQKMNLFVLDLSFIGWWILGTLLCGIGNLFVDPYYQATSVEVYVALKG